MPDAESVLAIAGVAAVAVLLLGVAAWMAAKARVPKKRTPPRRTFDHGRRLGRIRAASSPDEAIAALRKTPVGQLVRASATEERAEVVLLRRKSQPCEQAAGFLAGVFERAWAHEVVVEHPVCAGRSGECRYVVRAFAPARLSGSARPAAGGGTPRSADAHRRGLPARGGGA